MTESNKWLKEFIEQNLDLYHVARFLIKVLDSYHIEITPADEYEGVKYAEAKQRDVGKTFELKSWDQLADWNKQIPREESK